ncbi:MAG: hypothetical protein WCO52_04285 [bacterium]
METGIGNHLLEHRPVGGLGAFALLSEDTFLFDRYTLFLGVVTTKPLLGSQAVSLVNLFLGGDSDVDDCSL